MSLVVASVLVLLQGSPAVAPKSGSPGTPAPLDANLYFVDPVRGRDVGNGRNPEEPWRTLTHALPRAGCCPGVVIMAPGEYSEATGEQFPLPMHALSQLHGSGARILGPRSGDVPVFLIAQAGFQTIKNMEIVTSGVAFDITFNYSVSGRLRGWPTMDISVDIKARRAFDLHLAPTDTFGSSFSFGGSLHCEETAITLDGTWPAASSPFELRFQDCVLSGGPSAALVDLRVGGTGRVRVSGRNAAMHSSAAGIWLRPPDALDLSVDIDSSVFHALGNSAFGGGPLVVRGAGPRAIAIRRSIFSDNHLDVDLPGYDPATYVLEQNLVQQDALVGVGGNITGDPRFVDAPLGDFHLRPDSPARGVGLSATTTEDREGDPRGSGPDDDTTDLGLDEFYPRYHWYHPRPRIGTPTFLRILGEPGDVAMAFAGRRAQPFVPFGGGWQLGALYSPQPFAVAVIGPEGFAEVPLSLEQDLPDVRLTSPIVTQIRYLTPQGATEFSANAASFTLAR